MVYKISNTNSPKTLRTLSVVLVIQGTLDRNFWCFLLFADVSDLSKKMTRLEILLTVKSQEEEIKIQLKMHLTRLKEFHQFFHPHNPIWVPLRNENKGR